MPNPRMSLGLSTANSWAGAVRGIWTPELHLQQTIAGHKAKRRR